MGLEDGVPIMLGLLAFLPAFIGSNLDVKNVWQRMLAWALYVLSLLLGLIATQVAHLTLERLFGATPTALETSILNLYTYFMVPSFIYFTLFGLLLCLGIVLYFIQYIQNTRIGKTQ